MLITRTQNCQKKDCSQRQTITAIKADEDTAKQTDKRTVIKVYMKIPWQSKKEKKNIEK